MTNKRKNKLFKNFQKNKIKNNKKKKINTYYYVSIMPWLPLLNLNLNVTSKLFERNIKRAFSALNALKSIK